MSEEKKKSVPRRRAAAPKRESDYVDKDKFYLAMVEHKKKCKEAEESGDDPPQISPYIGECIMKIAEGFSRRPNFVRYTYREDMVGDAIQSCLQYGIPNFNPDLKSKNPFSYFTQICFFAFIQRIKNEHTQTKIKYAAIEAANRQGTFEEWAKRTNHVEHDSANPIADYLRLTSKDIEEIDAKKKKKKNKKRKTKKKPGGTLLDD